MEIKKKKVFSMKSSSTKLLPKEQMPVIILVRERTSIKI
jgi:hypothetical protein